MMTCSILMQKSEVDIYNLRICLPPSFENIINPSKFLLSIVLARLPEKICFLKLHEGSFNQFRVINQIAHYIYNVRANPKQFVEYKAVKFSRFY